MTTKTVNTTIKEENLTALQLLRLKDYKSFTQANYIEADCNVIYKSNKLIFKAHDNLSINTQRRYEALLSYMREWGDLKEKCVTLSAQSLAQLATAKMDKTPASVRKSLETLKATESTFLSLALIDTPATTLIKDYTEFKIGSRVIFTVYFHEIDVAQLLEIAGYTALHTEYLFKFKNKYAIKLYEFLKVAYHAGVVKDKRATFTIKTKNIRALLGVTDGTYEGSKLFGTGVLKRALKEIETITGLQASYVYTSYNGRYESAYIFTIQDTEVTPVKENKPVAPVAPAVSTDTEAEEVKLMIEKASAILEINTDELGVDAIATVENNPSVGMSDSAEELQALFNANNPYSDTDAHSTHNTHNTHNSHRGYGDHSEELYSTGKSTQGNRQDSSEGLIEANKQGSEKKRKYADISHLQTGIKTNEDAKLNFNKIEGREYNYVELEKQLLGWDE